MNVRTFLAALVAGCVLVTAGCAGSRGQDTVGGYVDDAAITTTVKARMVEDKAVDAGAVNVETLNGTVMISGFARSSLEKNTAESVAMKVKGVKAVQNNIVVRP